MNFNFAVNFPWSFGAPNEIEESQPHTDTVSSNTANTGQNKHTANEAPPLQPAPIQFAGRQWQTPLPNSQASFAPFSSQTTSQPRQGPSRTLSQMSFSEGQAMLRGLFGSPQVVSNQANEQAPQSAWLEYRELECEKNKEKLNVLFDQLKKLDPEAAEIGRWNIAVGLLSRENIKEIEYFLEFNKIKELIYKPTGDTFFMVTAMFSSPETMETLIDNVPKGEIQELLGMRNSLGQTALDVAKSNKNVEVMRVLIEAMSMQEEQRADFLRAVAEIEKELALEVEIALEVEKRSVALIDEQVTVAIRNNDLEQLAKLLKFCNVTELKGGRSGETILHKVAGNGSAKLLKIIIAAAPEDSLNVWLEKTNRDGQTAMEIALQANNFGAVEVLIAFKPEYQDLSWWLNTGQCGKKALLKSIYGDIRNLLRKLFDFIDDSKLKKLLGVDFPMWSYNMAVKNSALKKNMAFGYLQHPIGLNIGGNNSRDEFFIPEFMHKRENWEALIDCLSDSELKGFMVKNNLKGPLAAIVEKNQLEMVESLIMAMPQENQQNLWEKVLPVAAEVGAVDIVEQIINERVSMLADNG